ncbi:MAG: hypothetical protein AAFR23_00655 [Pseudomonadota bacterium]
MRNRDPNYCSIAPCVLPRPSEIDAHVTLTHADLNNRDDGQPDYSIITLVTETAQYAAMRRSFELAGFDTETCEFIAIDNRANNSLDAYAGLNLGLNRARGRVVLLCHQDVRLTHDGRAELDARLRHLSAHDPNWAVAGNAGGVAPGELAIRISDPHGHNQNVGSFPAQVASVDENFIIVRGDVHVGFSSDLSGFHLYGTDLALSASMAGYTTYVVDFHLTHLSPGDKSSGFEDAEAAFVARWSEKLRPRWLRTTCTLMYIDGGLGERALSAMVPRRMSPVLNSARRWLARRTQRPAGRQPDRVGMADGA